MSTTLVDPRNIVFDPSKGGIRVDPREIVFDQSKGGIRVNPAELGLPPMPSAMGSRSPLPTALQGSMTPLTETPPPAGPINTDFAVAMPARGPKYPFTLGPPMAGPATGPMSPFTMPTPAAPSPMVQMPMTGGRPLVPELNTGIMDWKQIEPEFAPQTPIAGFVPTYPADVMAKAPVRQQPSVPQPSPIQSVANQPQFVPFGAMQRPMVPGAMPVSPFEPVWGTPATNFNTILSPAEEVEFLKWKQQYAPQDSGEDYDLRGAFKVGFKPDPVTGHWPDRFKKPNHPTFSDESQYAIYARDKAGHWEGDVYVPPKPIEQPQQAQQPKQEEQTGEPLQGLDLVAATTLAPPPDLNKLPRPSTSEEGMRMNMPRMTGAIPSAQQMQRPVVPPKLGVLDDYLREAAENPDKSLVNLRAIGSLPNPQPVMPGAYPLIPPVNKGQQPQLTQWDIEANKFLEGMVEGGVELVEGFTTPRNIAILAGSVLGGWLSPAVAATASAYFTIDMLNAALQSSPQLIDAFKRGDTREIARIGTSMLGSMYFAGKAGSHTGKFINETVLGPHGLAPRFGWMNRPMDVNAARQFASGLSHDKIRRMTQRAKFGVEQPNQAVKRSTVQVPESSTIDNPDYAVPPTDPALNRIARDLGYEDFDRLTPQQQQVVEDLYREEREQEARRQQEVSNVEKDRQRVSGEVREREEPVQAESDKGPGGEAATAGGVFQGQEGQVETDDLLYPHVVDEAITAGKVSASALQRKFKIGYGRVVRILDRMQREGIIGPLDQKSKTYPLVKAPSAVRPGPPQAGGFTPVQTAGGVFQTSEAEGRGPVVGFQTSQGSTYRTHEDGTTTRTKTPHKGHDPKDVGEKARSGATYFVSPEDATRIGQWNNTQWQPGNDPQLLVRGDEITLTSINPQTGQRGRDGAPIRIVSRTPEMGVNPVELWNPAENSPQGYNGWRKVHAGNSVVRIFGEPFGEGEPSPAARPGPPQAGGFTPVQQEVIDRPARQFLSDAARQLDQDFPIQNPEILTDIIGNDEFSPQIREQAQSLLDRNQQILSTPEGQWNALLVELFKPEGAERYKKLLKENTMQSAFEQAEMENALTPEQKARLHPPEEGEAAAAEAEPEPESPAPAGEAAPVPEAPAPPESGSIVPEAPAPAGGGLPAWVQRIFGTKRTAPFGKFREFGRKHKVSTVAGTEVETEFGLMELDDIVNSWMEGYTGPQPRATDRAGSRDTIEELKGKLKGDWLGDNFHAGDGAPILDANGNAITGNHRLEAMKELAQSKDSGHIGRHRDYRQWVLDNAEFFGVNPETAAKMKNPVLVQRLLTEMEAPELWRFAEEANYPTTAQLSDTEMVKRLADISEREGVMAFYRPLADGSPNKEFITELMRYIPHQLRRQFQTADGGATPNASKAIKHAMLAKAFPDPDILRRVVEATHERVQAISNGLMKAVPRFIKLQKQVAAGDRIPADISPEIVRATGIVASLREKGQVAQDYINQQEFSAKDPVVTRLVKIFDDAGRRSNEIGDILNEYADLVDQYGSPKQGGMFGELIEEPMSREELIDAARQNVEKRYAEEEQALLEKQRQAAEEERLRVEREKQRAAESGGVGAQEGTPAQDDAGRGVPSAGGRKARGRVNTKKAGGAADEGAVASPSPVEPLPGQPNAGKSTKRGRKAKSSEGPPAGIQEQRQIPSASKSNLIPSWAKSPRFNEIQGAIWDYLRGLPREVQAVVKDLQRKGHAYADIYDNLQAMKDRGFLQSSESGRLIAPTPHYLAKSIPQGLKRVAGRPDVGDWRANPQTVGEKLALGKFADWRYYDRSNRMYMNHAAAQVLYGLLNVSKLQPTGNAVNLHLAEVLDTANKVLDITRQDSWFQAHPEHLSVIENFVKQLQEVKDRGHKSTNAIILDAPGEHWFSEQQRRGLAMVRSARMHEKQHTGQTRLGYKNPAAVQLKPGESPVSPVRAAVPESWMDLNNPDIREMHRRVKGLGYEDEKLGFEIPAFVVDGNYRTWGMTNKQAANVYRAYLEAAEKHHGADAFELLIDAELDMLEALYEQRPDARGKVEEATARVAREIQENRKANQGVPAAGTRGNRASVGGDVPLFEPGGPKQPKVGQGTLFQRMADFYESQHGLFDDFEERPKKEETPETEETIEPLVSPSQPEKPQGKRYNPENRAYQDESGNWVLKSDLEKNRGLFEEPPAEEAPAAEAPPIAESEEAFAARRERDEALRKKREMEVLFDQPLQSKKRRGNPASRGLFDLKKPEQRGSLFEESTGDEGPPQGALFQKDPFQEGGGRPYERPKVSPNFKKSRERFIESNEPQFRREFRRSVEEAEARLGDNYEAVPFERVEEEARALGQDMVEQLDIERFRQGATLDPVFRVAGHMALNDLNTQRFEIEQELAKTDITPDKRAELNVQLGKIREFSDNIIDTLMPMRSQDGRNLAYYRMTIGRRPFDLDAALRRARVEARIPSTQKLPENLENKIKDIVAGGTKAENNAKIKLREDMQQKMFEEEIRKLREQFEKENPKGPTADQKIARAKQKIKAQIEKRMAELDPNYVKNPKNPSRWKLTPVQEKQLENDPEVRQWRIDLAKALKDAHTTDWSEFIAASKRAGLLSGMGTVAAMMTPKKFRKTRAGLAMALSRPSAKNILGTGLNQALLALKQVPAAATDQAISAITGRQRTQAYPSFSQARAGYRRMMDKGAPAALEIFDTGSATDDLARLDYTREINPKLFEAKPGEKLHPAARAANVGMTTGADFIKTSFRAAAAADRMWKEYAHGAKVQELIELAELQGKELTPELLEEIEAEAILHRNYATFNTPTTIAKRLTEYKHDLRNRGTTGGKIAALALDWQFPYVNTPVNLARTIWSYLPYDSGLDIYRALKDRNVKEKYIQHPEGMLEGAEGRPEELAAEMKKRGWTDANQKQFTDAVGRGATGLALMGLFYWMASKGMLSGMSDTERGTKTVKSGAGRIPGALLFGGRWHDLSAFSPVGNLAAIAAEVHERQKEDPNLLRGLLWDLPIVGGVQFLDQPMVEGTSELVELINGLVREAGKNQSFEGVTGVLGQFAGKSLKSAVPTASADVAALFDSYRRDTRNRTKDVEGLFAPTMSRIPGLRNTLPIRRNVLGEAEEQSKRAIFDPTLGVKSREDDEVWRELMDKGAGITFAKKGGELKDRFTGKIKRVPETEAELNKRLEAIGGTSKKALLQLIHSDGYKSAPRHIQRELLESVAEKVRGGIPPQAGARK